MASASSASILDSVFFDKPARLCVDEDSRSRYASSQKIETLIAELREKGPVVALGGIGPAHYASPPKIKGKLGKQDVYGWDPGIERVKNAGLIYTILLGAKKDGDRAYVYYILSQDMTPDKNTYIRTHIPSIVDKRIFVVSHATFLNCLFDLYPPRAVSTEKPDQKSASSSDLSPRARQFADRLASIKSLDSILDGGTVESACKAIGQEIFDKYKSETGGNSLAAEAAVRRICDAVKGIASDGSLRSRYIERAWDGIGDDKWRWRG